MAVFLINTCKFNGCGITFPSLGDLIQHIEDTHIDYDPKVVEQKEQAQPACLPLSYVLRFISEDARKDNSFIASTPTGVELKRKLAIKHHSYSMSSSNRSNTPTGSEMDEDEMVVTESEDSNDSWTTEEFSSEFIMRYGSRHSGTGSNGTPGNEKPFACPVPGCKKRYKNVNGIKYHSKNGHKKDGKVRKGYKCHCGKSYKTAQGLKNHALAAHNSTPDSTLTTQHIVANSGGILLPRSSSPSQSLGSLSPSSISNMSSSASSSHGGNGSVQNVSSNILQQLTNAVPTNITGNIVANNSGTLAATTNSSSTMNLQIHQQQFNSISNANSSGQTHVQQQPTNLPISGNNNNNNNNNNFVRSTIGLVSIKSNNNNGTTAATNLLAANAAASKILKLAAANAASNNIEQQQQHSKLQQVPPPPPQTLPLTHDVGNTLAKQQQQHGQSKQASQMQQTPLIATSITSTKITLPNLVNLGILTPSTSPTKSITQGITFPQQQTQNIKNALAVAAATVSNQSQQDKILISSGGGSCTSFASTNNNNHNSNNKNCSTNKNNVIVIENIQSQTHQQQQQQQQQSQSLTPPQSQSQSQSNEHQISLPLTPISPNGTNGINTALSKIVTTSASTTTVMPNVTSVTVQQKTQSSLESSIKATVNAIALTDATGTVNEET